MMIWRPLLIGEAELGALRDGIRDDGGQGVRILRRLQDNFAADVLNADLYFHSKASQPIKVLKRVLYL
ncbi:hypothetical protein QFZ69_001020 [Arthrobacter sp. V1I7]|nr:hypothetical protein [Arthrobacter sp. V1I7]